eukprot:contig_8251_g1931
MRAIAIIVDQINKLLKLKGIERSHSDWASPVVFVPKKNGKARFCVDYRRLNNITKKDAYPLPRMEDGLDTVMHRHSLRLTVPLGTGKCHFGRRIKRRLRSQRITASSIGLLCPSA